MLAHQSKQSKKAMYLWKLYGDEYRTLIPTYEDLLLEKRNKNIKPLWKIRKTDLEEYPSIDFLQLEDESDAESYLEELKKDKLANLIYEIDRFLDSRIRRLLRARICDYRHQIRLKGCDKTPLAMDPDYKRKNSSRIKFSSRTTSE